MDVLEVTGRWLRRPYRAWRARGTSIREDRDRLAAGHDLRPDHRRLLDEVDLRIHPGDPMFEGSADHYLGVGLSAIDRIDAAHAWAGAPGRSPRRILDFAA